MYKVEFGSKKRTKIMWGLLLVLAAAALVVSKLGYLEGIGIWTILFTIGLLCFVVDGIFRRSFGEILFAIAFFIILNDELLGLEEITPWPVLGAALLGTIGLRLLFPKFSKHKVVDFHMTMNGKEVDMENKQPVFEETWDGSSVSYENAFGEAVKYLSGEISHIKTDNVFGSLKIYFSNAVLKGGSASVDVDNAFGSTVLFVPAGWKVVISADHAFGSTKEQGHCDPDGDQVLYIRGDVCFGSLVISYV